MEKHWEKASKIFTLFAFCFLVLGLKTNASAASKTSLYIEDGVYNIVPAQVNGYALDINGSSQKNGAQAIIWNKTNTKNQKFYIQRCWDGWYTIRALHSNKYLDLKNGYSYNGAKIQQWSYTGGDNQKWRFYNARCGVMFYIGNKSTGGDKVIDLKNARYSSGNKVHSWRNEGLGNQTWMLLPASDYNPRSSVYSDCYSRSFTYVYNCTKKIRILCMARHKSSYIYSSPIMQYKIYDKKTGRFLKSGLVRSKLRNGYTYADYSIPYNKTIRLDVSWSTSNSGFWMIQSKSY